MDYVNSILIGIGEDFSLELPDKRLWEQLSYRVINPLVVDHHEIKDIYSIKYIDEIINWDNYYKAVEEGKIRYQIYPSKFFQKQDLMTKLKVHFNKVRSI